MATNSKAVEKAEKALQDFLNEHPEMKEYQAEVARRLSKAPTLKNKIEILQFMIAERLSTLQEALGNLVSTASEQRDRLIKEARKNG